MTNEDKLILKSLGVKFKKELPIHEEHGMLNGYIFRKERYYWMVNGKIPYNIAKEFEKHKELEMRVCGSGYDVDHWCKHDWITEQIEKYWETHTLKMHSKENFEKFMGITKEEHFEKYKEEYYIPNYHIDTLEGLYKIIDTIKINKLKMEW